MPVALVMVVPTKTNLGLANAKGEVSFSVSGDLAQCCRELGNGLPNVASDSSLGGSAFLLSYVDLLDHTWFVIRELWRPWLRALLFHIYYSTVSSSQPLKESVYGVERAQ